MFISCFYTFAHFIIKIMHQKLPILNYKIKEEYIFLLNLFNHLYN
jgi:hypothetical protein